MPWQNLTNVPEGFLDGVDNDTLYARESDSNCSRMFSTCFLKVRGTADTAARSDHSHPPGDADTLDGLDSLDFAPATHDHELSALSGVLADEQLSPISRDWTPINSSPAPTSSMASSAHQHGQPRHGTFVGDGTGLTNLQGTLLSPGTIGPEALADSSVTTGKIAPGAVDLGTNRGRCRHGGAVSGSQIVDATGSTRRSGSGPVRRHVLESRW
jgi:hypothetical protein